jgi:hypothetical protein
LTAPVSATGIFNNKLSSQELSTISMKGENVMSNMGKTALKSENSKLNTEVKQVLESEVANKRPAKLSDATSVENWCFHNTKKLLKKYRSTKMCISAEMDKLEDDCESELGVRFEKMAEFAEFVDIDLSGTYLESRMKSMQKNRQMLAFIDRAVASMRAYDDNGEEFYWIIFLKYMAPNGEKCANDVGIVSKLRGKNIPISQSTFYRRLNAAISTLSGILWGFTARDTLQLTEIINKLNRQ